MNSSGRIVEIERDLKDLEVVIGGAIEKRLALLGERKAIERRQLVEAAFDITISERNQIVGFI